MSRESRADRLRPPLRSSEAGRFGGDRRAAGEARGGTPSLENGTRSSFARGTVLPAFALLFAAFAAACALLGCPQSEIDICYGAACTGADGAAGDGQVLPPGCDITKDPKDSNPCVDETIAYFVSGSGSDSNVGTKASPLQTIGAAVARAGGQRNRVYVCDGVYGESVTIASAVSVYGGFRCADWSYDGTRTKVGPHGGDVTLSITSVSDAIAIQDLDITSENGQKPGDSSVAIFVASSTVNFKRVTATAGDGVTGADAVTNSNYAADAGTAGTTATNDIGATAAGCIACANGEQSISGSGGNGGAGGGVEGADGGPLIPENPVGLTPAHNGIGGFCTAAFTTVAGPGADAVAADGGAPGAASPGSVSGAGWARIDGQSGVTGKLAQGGGGGGGGMSASSKGGGGSGGCGGCGGAGGAAGMSGGSSFAVLSFQSTLTFDACTLHAGNAGSGKAGGRGQPGQVGGDKGFAVPAGSGCNGGAGGNGGAGSGGGGGAGGNASAIGYVGPKPSVINGTTTDEGLAGADGGPGPGGAGNSGLSGAAGARGDVLQLQ